MENIINDVYQTPISQPTLVPEKPKTNYLVIALVLVVFALFLLGAYLLGRQSTIKPELLMVTPTESPVVTAGEPTVEPTVAQVPTLIPTVDPTAEWKIYKNDKYGFEFKYPADIRYLNDKGVFTFNDFSGILTLQNFPATAGPNYSDNATFQMSVYVKKNIDNQVSSSVPNTFVNKDNIFWVENNLNKTGDDTLLSQILSTFKFAK